jgi:hypothetical protein
MAPSHSSFMILVISKSTSEAQPRKGEADTEFKGEENGEQSSRNGRGGDVEKEPSMKGIDGVHTLGQM